MKRPVIHIAMIGSMRDCRTDGVWERSLQQSIIHRTVNQLMLVYDHELGHEVYDFLSRTEWTGTNIIPVAIEECSFSGILSMILGILNDNRLDDFSIEFNVSCASRVMIIVASVAAAIVHGTIICSSDSSPMRMTEVWPTELTNLTTRKKEILWSLAEHSQAIYQKELGRDTGIPPSGMSRHLYDLETAGYVNRETVSGKKVVKITDLGRSVIQSKCIRKKRHWGKGATMSHEFATIDSQTQKASIVCQGGDR